MIKKVFLSIMMVTAVTLFMVSCNNVTDDNSNGSDGIPLNDNGIPLNDIEKALLGKYTSSSGTYDFKADRTGNKTSGASSSIRAASPTSFTWSATTDGNVSIVLADGSKEDFTFDIGDMSMAKNGTKLEKASSKFTPTVEYLGTWKGKMTVVMGGNPITQDATVIVSADKIEIPGHNNSTTEYSTDLSWKKYDDGTIIVKGINKDDAEKKKYASVTYKKVNGKLTAYLYISVMKHISDALDKMLTQTDCYGTWSGTMTVKMGNNPPTTQSLSIKVAKDSVDSGGNYGAYTKVLWGKNADNKYFVAAQSDSTNTKNGNLTLENYTTAASCIIVFNGDGTATYSVPAMAAMGGTATLTKTN